MNFQLSFLLGCVCWPVGWFHLLLLSSRSRGIVLVSVCFFIVCSLVLAVACNPIRCSWALVSLPFFTANGDRRIQLVPRCCIFACKNCKIFLYFCRCFWLGSVCLGIWGPMKSNAQSVCSKTMKIWRCWIFPLFSSLVIAVLSKWSAFVLFGLLRIFKLWHAYNIAVMPLQNTQLLWIVIVKKLPPEKSTPWCVQCASIGDWSESDWISHRLILI